MDIESLPALNASLNATAGAQSRVWDFQAFLDDKPIGHHRFTLSAQGDTRELKSETRFVVKLLFITAYRYTHDAVEHWRGDWYPITLIREDYFAEYARDLVDDCGDLPAIPSYVVIDWEATADNLRVDYSEVDVDGISYLYR